MKALLVSLAFLGILVGRPSQCFADATPTAEPQATTTTPLAMGTADGRIDGPQSCGDYVVAFFQTSEKESEGIWKLTTQDSKKVLFHGDWARNCTLKWSPDCRRLAFSVAWGSNAEDLTIYDPKAHTETEPSKLVNLGLPKDAEIWHFYWKPIKWNDNDELIFEGEGNYTRKSEDGQDSAKMYGVKGTWAYKPDGTIRTISLEVDK
jgi:hypothetical protein